MARRAHRTRSECPWLRVALLLACIAAPVPAVAQDDDVDEIVVLGSESEASEDFATGDSVTGFSAEDLAALGAESIADLASFTPNLEIVTSGATTPTFFIRGVGLNDFGANSTGAVAIYQDDAALNAPALQLGTLFDMETVNILRGPQGTGLARNASAGAIKLYSRKPSGRFGGYLRGDWGKYNLQDYEGAVEAPIFEDLLAGRVAFRLTQRDGVMDNRCANALPFDAREPVPRRIPLRDMNKTNTDKPWSLCGERVDRGVSPIPTGLEREMNDRNVWAARGTLLFQPTLDMTWLLGGRISQRDELSQVGQAYGTSQAYCLNNDIENCNSPINEGGSRVDGLLGGQQNNGGYRAPEVRRRFARLNDCFIGIESCRAADPATQLASNRARLKVAKELAEDLDQKPWHGDFNFDGDTTNDTYGGYLKGEIVIPGLNGLTITTVSAYDEYERSIDWDLDFSPETLFHIFTDDDGWQFYQDLRLEGEQDVLDTALRWDAGGYVLTETLNVRVFTDLGDVGGNAREYTQELTDFGLYTSLGFDFWEDFTLDGGVRYNWQEKSIDYSLVQAAGGIPDLSSALPVTSDNSWDAFTGTVRLTYRFRHDTQAYWKYSRGWKPGHYNATASNLLGVTVADPEFIDAFEMGLQGSWFEGLLNADLSLFYYDYQDYQIFITQQFAGSGPEFVVLNANDAEVYGSELDVRARPWSGAFLNVRFSWLESQFLDFVQVQQANTRVRSVQLTINRELQNSGNSLLNSPQFKVSITAEQTLPLGRFGSLTPRYDGVWTDVTYYDATEGVGIPNNQGVNVHPEDTIGQQPFWLHNVRVAYRPPSGQIEVAFWVRNLTNEAYKTFAFDGNTFFSTSIYLVGEPRTYGVTAVVNF